jgi:hypothetical protein
VRNKFSPSVVRWEELLNVEAGSPKIWRELLKLFEMAVLVYVQGHVPPHEAHS